MALPASGSISMLQVATELGVSQWGINLNQNNVRVLAGVSLTSETRNSLNDLRGKAAYTLMSGSGTGDTIAQNETGNQYQSHAYPQVAISGGDGNYSYQWTINTGGGSFYGGVSNTRQVDIAQTISKYGYDGSTSLTCVITDGTARTLTISGIIIDYSST